MRLAAALACALASGCAAHPTLHPFTTDGCSLFPDRAGASDWSACCRVHDVAYWRGGSFAEREIADDALQSCVREASHSGALAGLMRLGVTVGGSAYLPTWFRWGYGWSYGRGYEPLTPAESAAAKAMLEAAR